jgi:hypothetical protein
VAEREMLIFRDALVVPPAITEYMTKPPEERIGRLMSGLAFTTNHDREVVFAGPWLWEDAGCSFEPARRAGCPWGMLQGFEFHDGEPLAVTWLFDLDASLAVDRWIAPVHQNDAGTWQIGPWEQSTFEVKARTWRNEAVLDS